MTYLIFGYVQNLIFVTSLMMDVPECPKRNAKQYACLHNHHLLAKQRHVFSLMITDTSATSALSHSQPIVLHSPLTQMGGD